MKKILEVKNIYKKYQAENGEIEALKEINFDIEEGEFISIIRSKWMWKINIIINNSRIRKQNIWRNIHRRKNRIYATKRQFIRMENDI